MHVYVWTMHWPSVCMCEPCIGLQCVCANYALAYSIVCVWTMHWPTACVQTMHQWTMHWSTVCVHWCVNHALAYGVCANHALAYTVCVNHALAYSVCVCEPCTDLQYSAGMVGWEFSQHKLTVQQFVDI